jgi:integrase
MLSRSKLTIYQRKCTVYVMARFATSQGLAPADVTRQWMTKYLLDQKADRKGNGFSTVYENLRQFWLWFGREQKLSGLSEYVHPMTGIVRPTLVATEVPVLEADQIKAIMAACFGTTYDAVRDRTIVLVLYQTGLRRAELSALNWSDFDQVNGTLQVQHGKRRPGQDYRSQRGVSPGVVAAAEGRAQGGQGRAGRSGVPVGQHEAQAAEPGWSLLRHHCDWLPCRHPRAAPAPVRA